MPPIHSSKLTMIIYCAEKLVLWKEHKNIYGVAYNTLIERAKYNLKKVFLLIREKNKETQKDWIKYY
jgi:HD superfamily phosphohydrolase YqeK